MKDKDVRWVQRFTNYQKALKQLQRMLDQAIGKFNYEQAMSIKEQMRKLRSQ